MKNKNGFTLVELLAVIAILAILVIIALPNVLNMYRDARKKSFSNELKEIYRSAQQQYLLESMSMEGDSKIYHSKYTKNNTTVNANLDLQGGNSINYCLKIDSQGNVLNFQADNGTYIYRSTDDKSDLESTSPLLIGDIDIDDDDVISTSNPAVDPSTDCGA